MTVRRAAAWAVLGVLLAAAALGAPYQLRSLRNDIAVGKRLTPAERADGGARHLRIDPDALERIESVIPERATYAIVVPPEAVGPSPLTVQGIRQLLRYRLLPRRNVEEGADWVVTYGGGASTLQVTRARP